ncbi:DgyrCDS10945 [Dimorphilus gyrociliatus]|uniref:Translation initiation factor eIF2B subunit gamma n=1 Tax=Dimorphilus gyrociliatus TaxID=2664684 RepID=A0A7I8W1Y3_9ANNE|nr:DgyrCDS10945 [Dimorphilus gyrociliatus]
MNESNLKPSFQAVVLAGGKGSRMRDVTEKIPKALVPIGNVPLIYFPLKSLERVGFQEAIVVVLKSQKEIIDTAITNTDLKLCVKFFAIEDEDDLGTAESLRLLKDRIDMDILVVSCDLITDLSFHKLADMHRAKNSSLTIMLAKSLSVGEILPPGGRINRKIENQFIALDNSQRLIYMATESDLEDEIRIRHRIIKNYPCINMHSSLMDSHVYLISKSTYDLMFEDTNIIDLREYIPLIVKKQFAKEDKVEKNENESETDDHLIDEMSSFRHQSTSINLPRCFGYFYDGLCFRVNNIMAYCEANRRSTTFLEKFKGIPTVNISPSISLQPKSTVNSDCLIGEKVTIGAKCGIKKSIIGMNTEIGDYCKVTNCIIMNKVKLRKGITIQNCIICENATLEEKCELKDCIVGADQIIHGMAKLSGEAVRGVMNTGFDLD